MRKDDNSTEIISRTELHSVLQKCSHNQWWRVAFQRRRKQKVGITTEQINHSRLIKDARFIQRMNERLSE